MYAYMIAHILTRCKSEIYLGNNYIVRFIVLFVLYSFITKKLRRVQHMKTATLKQTHINRTPALPFPNAATKREMLHKFLDLMLVSAIGAGLAACLLFFLALA